MKSDELLVDTRRLERDLNKLFAAVGTPPPNATLVVDHVMAAEIAGVPTHGVAKVADYIEAVERGDVDPAAVPVEVARMGSLVRLDGQNGFGQVGANCAVTLACDLAAATGIACVVVRRLGHTGRLGSYAAGIAQHGLLGLCCTSLPPNQHGVAWHGARDGRLGTNPIAYACPTGDDPIVADFSTSATSWGAIRRARDAGAEVPPGLIVDANGEASTNPSDFFTDPPGCLLPLGGAVAGYKGSALALLVELLATTLSGEIVGDNERSSNLFVLAITGDADLPARASNLRDYIRTARPRDPHRPVRVPGDRTTSVTPKRIRVGAHVWSDLIAVARRNGIDLAPS